MRGRFLFRYGLAVLFSGIGIILLILLGPLYSDRSAPLVLLSLPIAAAAWRAGAGPGLAATFLCVLGAWGWLIPPAGFAAPHPGESLRIALTAFTGIIISLMAGSMRRSMEAYRESDARLRSVFESIDEGFCIIEIILDPEAKPVDYRFLQANQSFSRQSGLHDVQGRLMSELVPEYEARLFEIYGKVAVTGESVRFIDQAKALGRWFDVYAFRIDQPEKRHVAVLFNDITEQKEYENHLRDVNERIKKTAGELARSNKDLEQFAAIISHDLQEPARTVESFGSLLLEKHSGSLDDKAREYLGYMMEGARRMSELIKGLLAYSRLDRGERVVIEVRTQEIVEGVLSNLQVAIDSAHAAIDLSPMPVVLGSPTQLTQLFQNLIGNALKYRKHDVPPFISLCADRQGDEWMFSITDNGIGFDVKYQDRIFELFQRLHTQEDYPGIGIGLAVCKKIVERHDGRIWVDSKPGQGSTFFFTLPVLARSEGGR